MQQSSTEIRVGLFVLVALVLGLLAASVLKGGISGRTGGYSFEIWFEEAPGVGKGSPVRLSGVEVGEVVDKDVITVSETGQLRVAKRSGTDILPYEQVTTWTSGATEKDRAAVQVRVHRLAPVELANAKDYQRDRNVARLKVRVRNEHQLFTRFNYDIEGGLVLGERQLNISDSGPDGLPLPADARGESIPELVDAGQRVAVLGTPPASLDAIFSNAQRIMDEETTHRLKSVISNIDRATAESGELLASLRATVQGNQGSAQTMMKNLSTATADLDLILNESKAKLASILDSADKTMVVASRLATANEARGTRIASNVETITANVAKMTTDNQGSLRDTMAELSGTAKDVRAMVGETRAGWGTTMGSLTDTSRNLQASSAEARERLGNMTAMMEDTTGRIRDLVRDSDQNLRDMAANSAAMTASARKVLEGIQGDLPEITSSLRETTQNTAEASARLRDLSGDPALRETLAHTEQLTAEAQALLGDVRRLTGDPQLQEDIRETVASAKVAAKSVASLTSGGLGGNKPAYAMSAFYGTRTNRWDSDLRLSLGMEPKRLSYHLFVDGLTSRVTLGAQLGRTMFSPNLLTRYGIYRGKLGLGADYSFGTNAAGRFDFYDPADPHLNFRYTQRLPLGLSGFVGVEDALDRPEFVFGAQLGAPFGPARR